VIAHAQREETTSSQDAELFELDYPAGQAADRLVVRWMAPTDGTDALLRDYAGQGVEVVCARLRRG